MDVANDQKQRCTTEAYDSQDALHTCAPQHSEYGEGRRQAEDCDRVPSTNWLHDHAPQLATERASQGDSRPAQAAPRLLGSEADQRKRDQVEYGTGEAAVLHHNEVNNRQTWPRAMRIELRPRSSKSEDAIVNWTRVGIPTMIMAIVVAHGQRARAVGESGGAREAANAVPNTIAYRTASRPGVTLTILPAKPRPSGRPGRLLSAHQCRYEARYGQTAGRDLPTSPLPRGFSLIGNLAQIPKASSARTMAPDSSRTAVTIDGVTRPPCAGRERAARQ